MASPTYPVFPSPPTSWPIPRPPPVKVTLLFEVEFRRVRLLQKALRILVSAAATRPADLSLAGAGNSQDPGDFYILAGGVFLVAKTTLPPVVDTCLAIQDPGTRIDVPKDRVVRFNLRRLEEEMNRAVSDDGDGEGLTLCLKGVTSIIATEILCTLKDEDDKEHRSMIPVISTTTRTYVEGEPLGSDWLMLEESFMLSFKISLQTLNRVLNLEQYKSPVDIRVTENTVSFKVGELETMEILAGEFEEINQYEILEQKREYPFEMYFSFHPRDAILNAVALAADHVIFHQIFDWRCCLEIPLNGLGSIYFCFDRH